MVYRSLSVRHPRLLFGKVDKYVRFVHEKTDCMKLSTNVLSSDKLCPRPAKSIPTEWYVAAQRRQTTPAAADKHDTLGPSAHRSSQSKQRDTAPWSHSEPAWPAHCVVCCDDNTSCSDLHTPLPPLPINPTLAYLPLGLQGCPLTTLHSLHHARPYRPGLRGVPPVR